MFPLYPRQKASHTIIDLGSGTAFAALNLSSHLATEDTVVVTDLEEVTSLLRSNVQKHLASPNASAKVLVRSLDWFKSSEVDSILAEFPKIDLVMACDLFYFKVLYPPLLRTLLCLASSPEIPVSQDYICLNQLTVSRWF